MALGQQQPTASSHAELAATHAATADPGPPAAVEWLTECCRVHLDEQGNVVSALPALMTAAVSQLVDTAADRDAAATAGAPAAHTPTRLHGVRAPGIGIREYGDRMLRYCNNSPVCYVAAFAYMLRLQEGSGGVCGGALRIDSLTCHRMMAVGTIIATKFFDDKFFSNQHYAQVAGVSLAEWNAMEMDMLFRLGFRARVGEPELFAALKEMVALAGSGAASMLPAAPLATSNAGSCSILSEGTEEAVHDDDNDEEEGSSAPPSPIITSPTRGNLQSLLACDSYESFAASAPTPALLPWAVAAASPGCGDSSAAAASPALQRRRSSKRFSSDEIHPRLLTGCHRQGSRHHVAGQMCRA